MTWSEWVVGVLMVGSGRSRSTFGLDRSRPDHSVADMKNLMQHAVNRLAQAHFSISSSPLQLSRRVHLLFSYATLTAPPYHRTETTATAAATSTAAAPPSLVASSSFYRTTGRSLGANSCSAPLLTRHYTSQTTRTMESAADHIEMAKKQAAYRAVDDYLLPSSKFVGIGSGSTVVYVVDAIVSRGPEFYSGMTFIPTGSQSKGLIQTAGLNMCRVDERPFINGQPVALDVAFDGADEVDEDLNLIKGGGACLFQEKLVATAARKFVAVAGESSALKMSHPRNTLRA